MATGSPKEVSEAPTGACNSLEARPSGFGAVRESAECEGQVPVGSSLTSLGEPVIQLLLSKKVFEEIIGYNSFNLCNQ